MRKLITSLLSVSLLGLMSIGLLAGEKNLKEHFEFRDNMLVGTTLVKKGVYLVKYNPETSEMKIMDGDKVVAQAKATVRVNDKKFDQDALLSTTTTAGEKLTGLRLGGQPEEITIIDDISGRYEEIPIIGEIFSLNEN